MSTLRRILVWSPLRLVFAVWAFAGAVLFMALLAATGVPVWSFLGGAVSCGLAAGVLHVYARRPR